MKFRLTWMPPKVSAQLEIQNFQNFQQPQLQFESCEVLRPGFQNRYYQETTC